jgi:hypothetical protein
MLCADKKNIKRKSFLKKNLQFLKIKLISLKKEIKSEKALVEA